MKSLDTIIEKLYEDNVFGKIFHGRFHKMPSGYETERNTKHFLQLVKKHIEISTISPEFIREFVDKIIVYIAEKMNFKQEQRITIYYNCIVTIEIEQSVKRQNSHSNVRW